MSSRAKYVILSEAKDLLFFTRRARVEKSLLSKLDIRHTFGDLAQVLTVGHDICGNRHARLFPVPILGNSHRKPSRSVSFGRDCQLQDSGEAFHPAGRTSAASRRMGLER